MDNYIDLGLSPCTDYCKFCLLSNITSTNVLMGLCVYLFTLAI